MIYLDSAATTRVNPDVFDSMSKYFLDDYGNPGSIHKMGHVAAEALLKARGTVAEFLSCKPYQIVFTGSGSEGNNLVLLGIKNHLLKAHKTHLIVSSVEHESTFEAVERLVDDGFCVSFVRPNKNGEITDSEISKLVRDDTGLIYVMYVNNETGAKNDLKSIGEFCKERGILFGSDCVQAAGQFEINTKVLNLDYAVVSGHKIGAPKGIGAVYIKDKKTIDPIICGGKDQEYGLRGGTENVPYIVGFSKACEICKDNLKTLLLNSSMNKQNFVVDFRKYMKDAGQEGYHFNVKSSINPGKVLSRQVEGVAAESLVLATSVEGLYISAGSACNAHNDEPSRVLMEYGLSEEQARNTVRVSFPDEVLSDSDIDEAARIMVDCIVNLRSLNLAEE